jgi:hypothetical protein
MKRSQHGGPRAYPIQEVFYRICVGVTRGHAMIKPGPNGEPPEIETFLIGRRRYATEEAILAFFRAQTEKTKQQTFAERSSKTAKATAASLKARQAPLMKDA